jgi:hypothetical protein
LEAPVRTLLTTYSLDLTNEDEPYWNAERWDLPEASLHDDVKSLVSAIFPYRALCGGRKALGAGSLMWEPSHQAALEAYLGLDLSPQRSYLLVRAVRRTRLLAYDEIAEPATRRFNFRTHLTEEGLRAIRQLPSGKKGRALPLAARYLRFFEEYGTHYVEAVVVGDCLFQVFSYEPGSYRNLKAAWPAAPNETVTGYEALGCERFITADYLAARGRLTIQSADPTLSRFSLDSIFHIFTHASADFLRQCNRVVPIEVELHPLNRFLNEQRETWFRRVLAGALLLTYGRDADVELRSGMKSGVLSLRGGGPDPLEILRDPAAILSHTIEAPQHTSEAAELRLDDESLLDFTVAAAEMRGALLLSNRSGERRQAVVDGLRFCAGGEGVQVIGDLTLSAHTPTAPVARCLLDALTREAAMRVMPAELRREHLAYLRWITTVAPPGDGWLDRLRAYAQHRLQVAEEPAPEMSASPESAEVVQLAVHAAELSLAYRSRRLPAQAYCYALANTRAALSTCLGRWLDPLPVERELPLLIEEWHRRETAGLEIQEQHVAALLGVALWLAALNPVIPELSLSDLPARARLLEWRFGVAAVVAPKESSG